MADPGTSARVIVKGRIWVDAGTYETGVNGEGGVRAVEAEPVLSIAAVTLLLAILADSIIFDVLVFIFKITGALHWTHGITRSVSSTERAAGPTRTLKRVDHCFGVAVYCDLGDDSAHALALISNSSEIEG